MSVTRNFVLLVALGGVLTLVASLFEFHGTIFLLWNLLIFAFLGVDALLTPSAKAFNVRRGAEDTLYFKAENEVVFYVYNASNQYLEIQGKDDSRRFFTVLAEDLVHFVPPKSEQTFSYITVPSKRGSFLFSKIFLRYKGVLGLCMKYAALPNPIEFKVYPNIRDLSKYRLLVQKNRKLPQGEKAVRQYGMGAEFESLRSYVDGDDYRKINWQATARENKLMVNNYQIERNQPVYIMLDVGRPMSYTVNGYKKLDYAINAALILTDIVNQQGDKAGLMVFDASVQAHLSPGQGAGHRNQLMETLYNVRDNRLTADYEGAFQTLCERQKRRSLVFIFTDFEILEEAQDLIAHMAWLKKRHLPIVVFMANEGLNRLTAQPVHKQFDQVLKDTATEFQTERKNIFRSLNAMGIPNVESSAEDFALSAVNRYLMLSKH